MTPSVLYANVMDEISKGNDLQTQPFVAFTGEICQYMVPSLCLYEYRLIDATDLDNLDAHVQNLGSQGFDFMFGTVLWMGHYLQWMCRMNAAGHATKEILQKSLVSEESLRSAAYDIDAGKPLSVVTEAIPLFHGRLLS